MSVLKPPHQHVNLMKRRHHQQRHVVAGVCFALAFAVLFIYQESATGRLVYSRSHAHHILKDILV